MSICRGCGTPIDWIRMKSGKMMPIDIETVFVAPHGNQKFITPEGEVIIGAPSKEKRDEVAYVPHWSTCRAAGQFRKRG